MDERIQTRIDALEEFIEMLEFIGIDKDYGSGLSEAYRNEAKFLRQMLSGKESNNG